MQDIENAGRAAVRPARSLATAGVAHRPVSNSCAMGYHSGLGGRLCGNDAGAISAELLITVEREG